MFWQFLGILSQYKAIWNLKNFRRGLRPQRPPLRTSQLQRRSLRSQQCPIKWNCLIYITAPVPNMDNIKMDRTLSKTFYIVFQVLKVLLIKICKIQPLDLLFLVAFISFYISRYHFSQVFRTSFNIIWKKDFRHKFSFFNRFTQAPTLILLTANPLSVRKVFRQCSLTYHDFSRLLCYYDA